MARLENMYISTLCLELHMLHQAGVTMENGLAMMLEEEPDKKGKMVLQTLCNNLKDGLPLSEAMEGEDYFPAYTFCMIKIGERTGRLSETLQALSKHYERQDRLLASIKDAILYPAVLLAMMIVIVMILVMRVLPIFSDVFGRMGAQMSPFALQLMQFGTWFRGASVAVAVSVFVVFILIFLIWFLIWFIPGTRNIFARPFKNKWVFGRLSLHQFVSSMALAMSSGLDVEDSISLAASLNPESKEQYEKCMVLLRSGSNLAEALKGSGILSARDGRMLSLGSSSGMADSAMTEIARRNGRLVQDEIASIISRIEPTLVITTSIIVAVILLSVMLPLIGIMTSIG